MIRFILAISVVLNLVLGWWLLDSRKNENKQSRVQRIIDGDTFVIEEDGSPAGRQIRLMSVNAPEEGLCGSKEAEAELKKLIEGKKVRIVGEINDHFGRLLALVYVEGKLVNEAMISSGWARFTSTASVESEKLKTAFQKAKSEKVGVFSPKCYQEENKENPKCIIKGNVREGEKTYFFPGCGNYSNVALELDQGDRWFCSEKEAKETGFNKAANCHNKVFRE